MLMPFGSRLAVSLVFGIATLPLPISAQSTKESEPARPWACRIVADDEPGIPMILTGRVIDQDGNPLPKVKVHVYHTDAQGRYHLPDQEGFRLSGTVWTNAEGRFEFRTIRPGPYPGASTGEHFHLQLTEGGIPDHFASIEFFDDRAVKLPVAVGRQGGSATYYKQFGWKPDPSINGQRVEVDLKVEK